MRAHTELINPSPSFLYAATLIRISRVCSGQKRARTSRNRVVAAVQVVKKAESSKRAEKHRKKGDDDNEEHYPL
jgi:hypothetical protein